jgi:xanthine dehydrogenase large subunit
MLHGHVVASPVARGRISSIDISGALLVPGVFAVLTAGDIPAINDISPFAHDEELLATREVYCIGQSIALVVAADLAAGRAGAAALEIELEELPAVLSVREAIAEERFIGAPHVMRRGDVEAALSGADLRISGEVETGGQDHFYLETHCALALPDEDGTYEIHSSTQHPAEVQAKVGEVLGISRQKVVVKTRRMGGGFGGKETQAAHFAAFAALGVMHTGRPVKIWLNRDQDMVQTGKCHPFFFRYEVGFFKEGRLVALKVEAFSDGGWSADLSAAILDRALFHLDNAYHIPALLFEGKVCRTNVSSNTAFRGFGGPQGMVVVERVMNRAAEALGMDPADVRRLNYYGSETGTVTPYWQEVKDIRLQRIHDELIDSSEYRRRRAEIEAFNAQSRWTKRGISFQPVKFGISFTASFLNQAGALVLVFSDGSVQINHGGTEMGQGLHTKMMIVCAHELGIDPQDVRVMSTATDKVPNTSATAASSGSDLNGQAVKAACATIRERMRPVAAGLLGLAGGKAPGIVFEGGRVTHADASTETSFAEVALASYMAQVSLSATGYYRTPDITYDREAGRGKPFHYFAYGGAVLEVEVNGLTGEHRVTRADILHDVGDSLVPTVDKGQVEGGFIQGLGWLTCEELVFDERGFLRTHSPDTYKIPSVGQAPVDFRVDLLARAPQPDVIYGSKAVGEPPFMLAIAVLGALRQAIGGFGAEPTGVDLSIPCTPESVLRAVGAMV